MKLFFLKINEKIPRWQIYITFWATIFFIVHIIYPNTPSNKTTPVFTFEIPLIILKLLLTTAIVLLFLLCSFFVSRRKQLKGLKNLDDTQIMHLKKLILKKCISVGPVNKHIYEDLEKYDIVYFDSENNVYYINNFSEKYLRKH